MKTTSIIAVTLVLVGLAGPVSASWVGVYADVIGTEPQVIQPELTLATFHVVVKAFEPITGVSFRLIGNTEFTSKTIIVGTDYLGYSHLGDPFTGVGIDFGECKTGTIHAMTVQYIATAPIECGTIDVIANPGSGTGNIELGLCAGGTSFAGGQRGYARTQPPHLSSRLPADGATNVSVDVQLSWTESYCYEGLADCFNGMCAAVYFGTHPDSLTETVVSIWANSFDPGPLEANTIYYWRLAPWYVNDYSVWRFATGDGPVATEESTWGRIKALYR